MVQGSCQHCTAYTRCFLTPNVAEACVLKQCIRESKRDKCSVSCGMLTTTGKISGDS